ncbi:ABC transporter ATP-binding protein [Skermania piniformis]|uniref:DUF2232 domain-containing protein n=1 Tax=Skermania pinensis TaxID=39122 RepID=A0ABX8S5L3_9ACTN|nr:ABC transporter ATP-binding protein [Skermania piniformis]QXQ13117.1 DUF2232 domain-containing protein [Skermania piniformis]
MTDRAEPRGTGPLRPVEYATGAVLGGLVVALAVVASVVPFAGVLQLLEPVPFGIVAVRYRARTIVATTVAAAVSAYVAAGALAAATVASAAVLGGIIGSVRRQQRGALTMLGYAILGGISHGLFAVGMLLLFSESRTLLLDSIRNSVAGIVAITEKMPGGAESAARFTELTETLLHWWWAWIGCSVALFFVLATIVAWAVLGAVLDRLTWLPGVDRLAAPPDDRPVDPLPIQLAGVRYRYPGSAVEALRGVDLTVGTGEFLAVVGSNGSGKSTLARVLAGRQPTAGTVARPGAAGLGQAGGTGVVLQRPESQTLGVLVADDVVWGLPPGTDTDVDGLLAEVGLGGLGNRQTTTLSGGQLQRLAVAAALARRPALLIADEATAMLDPRGRAELVALLSALPARHGITVVLITHHAADAAAADRVIHLRDGTVVDSPPRWLPIPAAPPVPARPSSGTGEPLLVLHDVHYTYDSGTPWAAPALRGLELSVCRGEAVLVIGDNGSGKSTLAWVMAGLITPDRGSCQLAGKPIARQVGRVALAFQHARLQLQRRTVGAEIASWGLNPGSGAVGRALDAVGLDRALAGRSIDELSGGQARRVALAGILAAQPQIVVLDEPLAGLDPAGRAEIVALLARLHAGGLTMVIISHDIDEFTPICNRTVRLESGRIAAEPELLMSTVGRAGS